MNSSHWRIRSTPDAKKRELDIRTTGVGIRMAMQALDVPAVSLNAFQVMMHSAFPLRECQI